MSGAALINADNDVYLPGGKIITITGILTGNLTGTGKVATITPASYLGPIQILGGDYGTNSNYTKFDVTRSGGADYVIELTGKLSGPIA
jgi:hypothetical protein